jgi:hypothetical protein
MNTGISISLKYEVSSTLSNSNMKTVVVGDFWKGSTLQGIAGEILADFVIIPEFTESENVSSKSTGG